MTANTQHFCQLYKENNQKMIVYNDADLEFLLLIIDKKYWKIEEKGTELQFTTEYRVPIGSSDLLSDEYKFAIKYRTFHYGKGHRDLVAFYKVLNVFLFFFIEL